MSLEEIHARLEELRSEVAELSAADAETRRELDTLIVEVERQLAGELSESRHRSLIQSLQDARDRFEVEHPRTTVLLNDLMVKLASMGI